MLFGFAMCTTTGLYVILRPTVVRLYSIFELGICEAIRPSGENGVLKVPLAPLTAAPLVAVYGIFGVQDISLGKHVSVRPYGTQLVAIEARYRVVNSTTTTRPNRWHNFNRPTYPRSFAGTSPSVVEIQTPTFQTLRHAWTNGYGPRHTYFNHTWLETVRSHRA